MMLRSDSVAEALVALYREAELRLGLLVERGLRSGALGTVRYRRLQMKAVRAILLRLQAKAQVRGDQLVTDAYRNGTELANLPVSGAFHGVDQRAVNILAENLADQLKGGTMTVGRRVHDTFRREGLRYVGLELAGQLTRREASSALAGELRSQGITAFTDRAGRNWGLENYAAMVIRTTSREAVSHGTANRLLARGRDLVRISSHSHEPDVCSPYDGKTFSLTGKTEGYEQLDRYPPYHPNCKHVMTPAQGVIDKELSRAA